MKKEKEVQKQKKNNDNGELIFKLSKEPEYWNANKINSYDCFLNLILGGRGIGKTTELVDNSFKKYQKRKEQFIYVRRWKSETKKVKKMPSKYISNKYTDVGIGDGCYAWVHNKDIMGYCMALSVSQQFKSVDFDRVTTIIYDEAIIKRSGTNRYLENEMEVFLELLSTVFRTRKNVKVYILGNNQDVFNPFFEYFNVPAFKDFYINKERGIACELCKHNAKLIEKEKETGLYKLTKDTAYGEYHYNNALLISDNSMIMEKPNNLSFCFSLICNNTTLHIYNCVKEDYLYCEYIPEVKLSEKNFKIMIDNKINYSLCKALKGTQLMKRLVWYFYNGDIKYSSQQAVAILEDIVESLR